MENTLNLKFEIYMYMYMYVYRYMQIFFFPEQNKIYWLTAI